MTKKTPKPPIETQLDGDDWKQYNLIGQEKRRANRKSSGTILSENNVPFDSHNGGAHLVVRLNNFVVDFWPGTGKYIVRGSNTYKRGIFRMLRDIGAKLE